MGHRGAQPIGALSKHDVERLLADYDDDPVSALTAALRVVLDRPAASFDELVAILADDTGWTPSRRADIVERVPVALDALAAELNEVRNRERLRRWDAAE